VDPLNVVVMGAGAVGGYFGARLLCAGQRVTFVARGAHLQALQRQGLRVRSTVHGELTLRVHAVERPSASAPADLVLLTVKTYDTEAALELARPVVGPATAVLSLQNGVEAPERITARLGPGHALGGAAWVFATVEAPGTISHRFGGRVALGELDGRLTARVERIRQAFIAAGIPTEVAPDIRRVLWEKYLFICAQAGVTALTRCPTSVIRAVPETWRLYRGLLEELFRVARAAGIPLAEGVVDEIMHAATALAPETTSSLAHDLAHGRRLELETLHGYAVRLAERLGLNTPLLFAVYAALKPHVDGRPPA
jgi:2-dehydropantoate 2-reductase